MTGFVILGLDQSITQTGWALYSYPGDERRMKCGSFSCATADDAEGKCDLFAYHIKRLIGPKDTRPDFIVWERAKRQISSYPKKTKIDLFGADNAATFMTVNADQLLLPEIQGIIRGGAIFYSVKYESVSPATWRAALYGKGGGKLLRADAKARAKDYCAKLGINASNENEAEAACIARWAATCSLQFRLHMAGAAQ